MLAISWPLGSRSWGWSSPGLRWAKLWYPSPGPRCSAPRHTTRSTEKWQRLSRRTWLTFPRTCEHQPPTVNDLARYSRFNFLGINDSFEISCLIQQSKRYYDTSDRLLIVTIISVYSNVWQMLLLRESFWCHSLVPTFVKRRKNLNMFEGGGLTIIFQNIRCTSCTFGLDL